MYNIQTVLLFENISTIVFWLSGLTIIVIGLTILVIRNIMTFHRFHTKEHKPLNTAYSNIMEGIDILRTKMDKLDSMGSHFMEVGMKFSGLIKPGSPYELTDEGKELLEKSGATKLLEQHLEDYFSRALPKPPSTPADLEKTLADFLYLESEKTNDFSNIKNFIYLNPEFPKGGKPISIFTLIDLMTIYMRDIYLQNHPEISK